MSFSKKIGYTCTLTEKYNETVVFKITPKYKSKQAGDLIGTSDSLLLQSKENSGYLCYDEVFIEETDSIAANSKEDPFRIHVHKSDTHSSKSIAYMSREPLTNWNISIYKKIGQDENLNSVCGGDLVRFQNPELKGF